MKFRYSLIVPMLFLGMTMASPAPVFAQVPQDGPSLMTAAPDRRTQGTLVIEGVPEIPQSLSDRMLQYLSTRSASVCGWSPDGKGILIYTRLGDTAQVHRVANPGACREQLTFFREPVHDAVINPDPAKHSMLILKDIGGNENYQIFGFDLDTGRYSMLSDGKHRCGSVVWSPKGDRYAYQCTERNGTDWDIWVADPSDPASRKMVFSDSGDWAVLDWSPDGKSLLLIKYVSITDSLLAAVNLDTSEVKYISPDKNPISFSESAVFSADSGKVFFASDKGGEFRTLRCWDLKAGKETALSDNMHWDVENIILSPDGKTLAYAVNEDGIVRVYLRKATEAKAAARRVEGLPVGIVTGLRFSPDSKKLAVSINGSKTPGDVFAVDLGDSSVERWTFSEVGGLDSQKFIEPELIHYQTFDKENGKPREIPAFVYRPEKQDGPVPVLINIHGGPESQFQPYFSSLTQYMVKELGIAVVCPNVRGSAGYGKTYVKLDNGYLREDSVKDIGSLLDWIAKDEGLDAGRVAVMGGSYGGYMTLASLTHYSDRLRCGVDNVGISNFVTFLNNTQGYRRDLRRVEYGDERDPKMRAFMEKIAPANNASKIKVPLFVIQGKNDPRVPVTEAEQMVEEVRRSGGDVWYLMAEDEGHGFRKKNNRDYYLQAVVLFLQKYLI